METAKTDHVMIPPPGAVRVELARTVRETRRLRSLLRLAVQTEEDREFVERLHGARRLEAAACP